MPDFNELVKNLYTSKNRELTQEKLDYIKKTYTGKEEDFVKNFYATVGEELPQEKLDYISKTYLRSKAQPTTPDLSSFNEKYGTSYTPKEFGVGKPTKAEKPVKEPIVPTTPFAPTYIDPTKVIKTKDVVDINAEKAPKTMAQIDEESRIAMNERRIGTLTQRNLDENIEYQNLLVKKKAKELGYTDDKSLNGTTAVQKLANDREEGWKEDYLEPEELAQVRAFEDYQVFKQQGKEKESNEALQKYLNSRSEYRKKIDEDIINLKGDLASAEGDDALLIKATISELEAKKLPFYDPKKQMESFLTENEPEVAAVSRPTETAQEKLKKYVLAQDNLVRNLRSRLGLTDKSHSFQRFTEEWKVLEGDKRQRDDLEFLHNQELKLKNAVQILELNRTPLDKDSALGVFAKEYVGGLIPQVKGFSGTDNTIAANVGTIVQDADITYAANEKQLQTAKFANNQYQFGSAKWIAQNLAPTLAVMTEMIPAAVLTEGIGSVGYLSRLSRPLKILAERGSLGKAGGTFFKAIQANKYGRGLLKAAASGVNYGIESQAVTMLAPQLKDEMGFSNGLFAGTVGSAAGQIAGKVMETSLKSIATLFGNKAPQAIAAIEKYGSVIAKAKEFSNTVAGETTEEYGEQLASIYKESDNYKNFIYNLKKHYETTDALEEFATILMMSVGAPAGSTLGRSLFNASKKAYNNLSRKERETASRIADEIHNEVNLAMDDAANQTIAEENIEVPTRSAEEQDNAILQKQKDLKLPTAPEIVLSDISKAAMAKMENGEALTIEELKELSNELYQRYNGISATKDQDNRQFTTEQINETLGKLENNITLLENSKNKLEESGETSIVINPKEAVTQEAKPVTSTPNTKFYQGIDFNTQTGLPNGDYTEAQVAEARLGKINERLSKFADSEAKGEVLADSNPKEKQNLLDEKKRLEGVLEKGKAVEVSDIVEIKNEGKADAPTKENIDERLRINHPFYKKVEDALFKLGIIEKYNAETGTGDILGGYSQEITGGGFSVGKFIFGKDGSISYITPKGTVQFDKNGNVISENTKEVATQEKQGEIKAKKQTILDFEKRRDSEAFKYKEVTESDIIGNKKKVKRLKTPQELKESTDKINAAIDKAKAELKELEPTNEQQNDEKSNNKQSTNEANGEVVLEGVRETGNKDEGRKSSEQLREEEVAVKSIADQIEDLRAKEKAEYDAMPNQKDDAKREKIYEKYNALITPLLEQQKEEIKQAEKTTSVYVAPFYDAMVETTKEANDVEKSPAYKKYVQTINSVAEALGIKIKSIATNIGAYTNDDKVKVREVSTKVELETTNIDEATEFAVLMGALAPEVQESTIAAQGLSKEDIGTDKHTADLITVKVDNLEEAIAIAKKIGLDHTINLKENKIDFIDFNYWGRRTTQRFQKNLGKFITQLKEKGINYEAESESIESRFIESGADPKSYFGRKNVLERMAGALEQDARDTGDKGKDFQKRRKMLRDAVQEAIRRNNEFIRQQELASERAEYGKLRTKQIELEKNGERLSDEEIKRFTELLNILIPSTQETIRNASEDYEEARKEIEKVADKVIGDLGFLSTFGIKRAERAATKILRWYKGKAQWLGDGARTNLIAYNEKDVMVIYKKLQAQYKGGVVRLEKDPTELGYPKKLLEVRTSNGKIAEFQVMTPEGYLAKDGINGFPKDKRDFAAKELAKIQKRLGWLIPDGVGHYFYEIERDFNVPTDLRERAKAISLKYYDAFLKADSKYTEKEFLDEISQFKKDVDAADKTNWDKGNNAISPVTVNDFIEDTNNQYEPIKVSDTSHDTFTKDNAVDYEEGEREGDNGRSYPYLASVTVELVDDNSGDTIGTISKLKSEDGEITWNAETNDGDLVAEEASSKAEAQQALVDNYNKQKEKQFNKEKAKGIKERTKQRAIEAEKAAKAKEKAEKESEKEKAEKEKAEKEKAKPEQTEKEKAKEKAKEALRAKAAAVNAEVVSAAQRVQQALEATGITVEVIDNEKDFQDKLDAEGVKRDSSVGASGVFISKSGKIFINASKVDAKWGSVDVWHEGTHPIINIIRNTNPKLYKSIINGLNELVASNPEIAAVVEWAQSNYEGENTLEDETITETIARIANGNIDLSKIPTSLKDKIVDFINGIAKSLGLKPMLKGSNIATFKKMAKEISAALTKGKSISGIVGEENVKDFGTPIGTPSQLKKSFKTKKEGSKVVVNKKGHKLSFVKESDIIDMEVLINDIVAKNQKVWFWVADQLGRGFYFDKVTKKKHYLDAGASFALDPENRDKNIIWATGKGEKAINRYVSESDYIFIISGSPLISKLFNKRVFELLEKRFKNYNDFKKGVLENSKTKDIIELVNSFDSWESFKESPKRKELLLAIDAQKDKNTPLKLFLEKNNAFLDYNALRDGFYADNDFKLNDIMLVLKPTGFGGQSNHSTYSNNVLGDVVGVPDRKINAYDLMTSEFKKENDLKPSAQSQVVAPFGIGVKNIVAPQFSKGNRDAIANENLINGFYSPLEKTINESKQDKMPAKQWIDKFAKGEEAKWTGLTDWLSSQTGSVSKADIQNYLDDNRIEVTEVVKSSEISDEEIDTLLNDEVGEGMTRSEAREFLENEDRQDDTKFSAYQLEGEKENYKEVLVTLPTKSTKFKYKLGKRLDGGKYQIEKANGKKLPTVYQDMFEAGKALRELNEKEGITYDASKNFESTHFDEANILVHLRMNTRTDSQGNKVLFIEEVQSDWGQEGKRRGFEKPEDTQAIKELENEKQKVLDSSKSYQLLNENTEGNLSVEVFNAIQQIATKNIDNQYSTEESRKERFLKDIENTLSYWENYKYVVPNMNQKELSNFYDVYVKELENNSEKISGYSPSYQLASVENKLKDINKKIYEFSAKEGVKKAPFVMDTNAWTKLGLKVALKEAVRQGAKKIAWTTGEQQNDRYDLSKKVKFIDYSKNSDGTYDIGSDIEGTSYNDVTISRIEDIFGKEIAEKVQSETGVKSPINSTQTRLEGLDLKVGGKGMKGFYGSPTEGSLGIVGNVAKSLFKQEPKTVEIDIDVNQRYKVVDENGNTKFNEPSKEAAEARISDDFNKNKGYKIAPIKGKQSTQYSIDITPELKAQVREGLPQFSKGGRDVQPVVDMIKESQDEGELTDKEIAETLEEYFPKEDIQAAFDLINNPTENESPKATTEQAEFTPNAKDIKAFEKILETTSGAIRKKNIIDAVKVNPKIQEIMDNFDELKKQLMASVELTEDCSW